MPRIVSFVVLVIVSLAGVARAQDDLDKRATWSIPTTAEVKARLDDYLATKKLDESVKLKIEGLWPDDAHPLDGGELLDRLAASLAAVEPKAAEVVTAVRNSSGLLAAPKFDGLADESLPAFIRDNLRLFVGRWLAQHDLVDESLEVLKDVKPDNVTDPATLLFYRAVGHHRVLKKDECLTTVAKLLERESELPRRYVT